MSQTDNDDCPTTPRPVACPGDERPIPIGPPQDPVRARNRPGCVTAYALLMIIGGGIVFLAVLVVAGSDILFEPFPSIALLVYALLNLAVGLGLWHMHNWARVLVIIDAVISLIGDVLGAHSDGCTALVGIALNVWILWWFAAHRDKFD